MALKIRDFIDILKKREKEGYEFISLAGKSDFNAILGGTIQVRFFQCPYCTPKDKKNYDLLSQIYIGSK